MHRCLTSEFQDFYLDLVEDNRRITPRDYLELALRPVQGSRKDIAAKNEVIDILFIVKILLAFSPFLFFEACLWISLF